MDLDKIVSAVRNYKGVTRKNIIADVIGHFPIPRDSGVLWAFGEDAAVIEFGDEALLLAADGIMEDLMEKNGFWAGYCSVLVNVNDIAAMGGIPLGMVSVISMRKGEPKTEVLKGIKAAITKFGVPMVGGHTHPDCNYNALDVAIMGHVKKDQVILSSTASEGDDIIFAMDISGKFTPNIPYSWDSTGGRTPREVRAQVKIMNVIAQKKLLSAAKDISNPGCLGTLGMLLETSGCGAEVDISKIPNPGGVDLLQWLLAYQGCGFVATCRPKTSRQVLKLFKSVSLTGQVAGKVKEGRRYFVSDGSESQVLFDFEKDVITGCVG